MRMIYFVYAILFFVHACVYSADEAHATKNGLVWCLHCLIERRDYATCSDETHILVAFKEKDKETLYNLTFAQRLLREAQPQLAERRASSVDPFLEVHIDR